MRKRPMVLNWHAKNKKLTRGLQQLFSGRKGIKLSPHFTTLRLGDKWARRLRPGDRVAISISDDPKKSNIIGYVLVRGTSLNAIPLLRRRDLRNNIGAKTYMGVLRDMQSVYPPKQEVSLFSIVSVLSLTVID
ncbi:MAG: hypothetical protein WAP51_01950 [Candidatus Sungiibacteriota bacterium]